ncbi:MEDS domain-containing protein [Mesobacillus subterraneus]|uniref:3-ketoacyl-ACP reductase n=1 Tax=Mesobacillus subterraneus TaxID=285983 RepID=A0A3R9ECI4_9BACI|nr:MEDS domain-containing protein [Mesobacillus subterraneus]RSD28788.1 3-ketoacyl-ACP reductase [Mesobacillus subterraneus]
MENFLEELIYDLQKKKQGHIFYYFNDKESYIQNAFTFIVSVINSGSHIMLVENDRNLLLLQEQLNKQLNEDQWKRLHILNNFDFYYSNRDFHAETILSYFKKNIEPLLDTNVPICTWGLVEWSDEKNITANIEKYEQEFDQFVREKGIISVCAYDAKRTPEKMKEILMRCHEIMMTDDQYVYLESHSI